MAEPEAFADALAEKLAVEEYKSCRDLIAKNIEIIEKNEVYAVGSSAAVAVFSISQHDRLVCLAASYLPLAISILGFLRFFGVDQTIRKINNYLVTVERRHEALMGWTQFYRAANKLKWLKWSRYLIWGILFFLSVVFIYIVHNIPFPRN